MSHDKNMQLTIHAFSRGNNGFTLVLAVALVVVLGCLGIFGASFVLHHIFYLRRCFAFMSKYLR